MKLRMPTRLRFGEGRAGWGSNRREHPSRSAGVVGTARWNGDAGNLGRPVEHGVAAPTPAWTAVLAGVGQGHGTAEAG